MSGAIRKTMMYLGLADDGAEATEEDYEEYEDTGVDVPREYQAQVTPLRRTSSTRPIVQPTTSGQDLSRITTVHPRSYNDARLIGEAFRAGTPVIMNLSDMDDADAKRLVDFSAGLIFGLRGRIERVTNKVFLLSPENIEVVDEGHAAATDEPRAGFYNQS